MSELFNGEDIKNGIFNFYSRNTFGCTKKAMLQCGEDALVVDTKEIQKGDNTVYEITVTTEEKSAKK